jgi:hypothetical protein
MVFDSSRLDAGLLVWGSSDRRSVPDSSFCWEARCFLDFNSKPAFDPINQISSSDQQFRSAVQISSRASFDLPYLGPTPVPDGLGPLRRFSNLELNPGSSPEIDPGWNAHSPRSDRQINLIQNPSRAQIRTVLKHEPCRGPGSSLTCSNFLIKFLDQIS